MRKKILISGVVLIVLAGFQILRILNASGAFSDIHPTQNGTVSVLKGMIGAEDITIDRSIRKALVSADDRRAHKEGKLAKGAIYLLDYMAEPPAFVDVTEGVGPPDFHPHGLSLYQDQADGSKWLFVVNHREIGNFIEIFEFTDSSLVHAESVSDDKIASPNDVVGVGKRSFYFTNDHATGGDVSHWEDFLMIGTGQVGYYNGESVEIVADGLMYPNGINLSKDRQHLLVATTTGRQLLSYGIESHQLEGKLDCETALDNIELDQNGDLWIGCHPKMLAFLGHAKDPAKRSPSEVLQVEPNYTDLSKSMVKTIYENDGNPLSGSSVAATDGHLVLLGTVFEDGVLIIKN